MINLIDTFNNVQISSHRTLEAAVKKQVAHYKALKKSNGQSCYLSYGYSDTSGAEVSENEIYAIEQDLREWK
tara:strand:- start:1160 stop:1375 length:216 start_codon:yes stop_codon:yes gene_type:complete